MVTPGVGGDKDMLPDPYFFPERVFMISPDEERDGGSKALTGTPFLEEYMYAEISYLHIIVSTHYRIHIIAMVDQRHSPVSLSLGKCMHTLIITM